MVNIVLKNLGSSDIVRIYKSLVTLSAFLLLSFQVFGVSSQGNFLSPLINLFFRVTLDSTPLSVFTDFFGIFVMTLWFIIKVFTFVPIFLYLVFKISDFITGLVWGLLKL